MIQNEREYGAARRRLGSLEGIVGGSGGDSPASRRNLIAEIKRLREQVAEFEALRDGRVTALALSSVLEDLPSVLARARIARGWRQGDLAVALGITEQQVQKDERGGYDRASLSRLRRVAAALGLRLAGHAVLPQQSTHAPTGTDRGSAVSRIRIGDRLNALPSQPLVRPVLPPQPALRWDLPPLSGTASDPALNVDLRVSVSPC
jgi:transcriptional regulator with XRE-family HTH domain